LFSPLEHRPWSVAVTGAVVLGLEEVSGCCGGGWLCGGGGLVGGLGGGWGLTGEKTDADKSGVVGACRGRREARRGRELKGAVDSGEAKRRSEEGRPRAPWAARGAVSFFYLFVVAGLGQRRGRARCREGAGGRRASAGRGRGLRHRAPRAIVMGHPHARRWPARSWRAPTLASSSTSSTATSRRRDDGSGQRPA